MSSHSNTCQCGCEPPRYLRDASESIWHLRDIRQDAECTCLPLCQVRYDGHATLVGSARPVNEPICPACSTRYLTTVDDDPGLTSSLLVSLAMVRYIERTPRMEQTFRNNRESLEMFRNIQGVLYHVAESLILASQTQMFVRSILERVIEKTLPSEEELAEEDRRRVIAYKLAADLVAELFAQTGDDENTEATEDDSPKQPITWSAVLAPVGVSGNTGQLISVECAVTVREGAPLLDEEGTPIGRVDSAAIVNGYLTVTGVLDEDINLSDEKPTFDGGVHDRRTFGSSDDPTVTFETLEINAVRFGHALAGPVWSDPMIAFTRGSIVEQEKPAEV